MKKKLSFYFYNYYEIGFRIIVVQDQVTPSNSTTDLFNSKRILEYIWDNTIN